MRSFLKNCKVPCTLFPTCTPRRLESSVEGNSESRCVMPRIWSVSQIHKPPIKSESLEIHSVVDVGCNLARGLGLILLTIV